MHDRRAVFSMIILPAFFVCGGMLVATAFPPPSDLPPRIMTLDAVSQVCDAIRETSHVPYANREKSDAANALENAAFKYTTDVYINLSQVPAYLHPSGSCGADCSWPRNMTSYLLDTAKTEERTRRTAVDVVGLRPSVISLSATTLDLDPMGANLFFDNRAYHSLPVSINLMNNALLRTVTGSTPAFIETTNHPLNRTAARKTESYLRSGTDLTVAINVIIALSFVPASFVVFLVHERVTKSKHLQFVSGVEPGTYWLANYVWDLCNYLVPAFICIFVFLAFGLPAYTGRNFPTVIALVLLYGAAITPLMYPSNWIFNVPSTAYISLICINLFIGLTATLATFVLELFPDDPELQDVNDVLRWLFLIFPNYCLGRGLMDLARNEYIAEYSELAAEITGSTSRGFTSPFTWKLVGRNLVFLAIEAVVFLAMTYVIELIKSSRTARKEQTRPSPIALAGEDSDVIAERKRVENETDDLLRVRNLTKIYKSRGKLKVAVNQLTFGVPHGQCFGLLGVNGAGKTSTFQMLTNDLSLTSGDAWIDGYSVVDHVLEVRQRMGYCPQFDALSELLTGRQTLMMYARIHGIPEERVHDVVEWAVQHLQLGPWADRLVRGYSGGNRRKLSVAVAIAVSDAPIIFLDEPTSGMDPKARRFLWDLITTTVRSGRSVVLTSHSMEECDALCTRLAIMVNGAFRCLGSPQHIKTRYGDGYTLIIKVTGSTPDVAPVQGYIQSVFPHAVLKECHHGYLRYQLPARDMPPMADVFSALERAKETLPVEDYSLSQTSLDEIFCNFAAEQHTDRNDAVLPITGSTSVSQA